MKPQRHKLIILQRGNGPWRELDGGAIRGQVSDAQPSARRIDRFGPRSTSIIEAKRATSDEGAIASIDNPGRSRDRNVKIATYPPSIVGVSFDVQDTTAAPIGHELNEIHAQRAVSTCQARFRREGEIACDVNEDA